MLFSRRQATHSNNILRLLPLQQETRPTRRAARTVRGRAREAKRISQSHKNIRPRIRYQTKACFPSAFPIAFLCSLFMYCQRFILCASTFPWCLLLFAYSDLSELGGMAVLSHVCILMLRFCLCVCIVVRACSVLLTAGFSVYNGFFHIWIHVRVYV